MDMGAMVLGRDQQEHMRHMEQLRREGHSFFKIIFRGEVKRVHCLKDINLTEHDNLDGTKSYTQVEGDRVIEPPNLEPNPITGQYEAWVYDDPDIFNRFWMARNMDAFDIFIEDERIRKNVESLKTKDYKIAETEKELLLVEKHKIERQLRRMEEEEKKLEDEEERAKSAKKKTKSMTTDKIRTAASKPVDKPVGETVKVD